MYVGRPTRAAACTTHDDRATHDGTHTRHSTHGHGLCNTAMRRVKSPWLYDIPEWPARYAVLLYGRVGSLETSPTVSLRAKRPNRRRPSEALLQFCAATHRANLIDANLASGGVDVFVHTWNPRQAWLINSLYPGTLRASQHDNITQLPSAASQALSIGRAAALARRHETTHNHTYALALALRIDAAALEPLLLHDLSAANIWFAAQCCASAATTPKQVEAVEQQCGHGVDQAEGGPDGRIAETCRVNHYRRRPSVLRDPAVEAAYHLKDWWFASGLDTVLTWTRIASSWDWYVSRARALRILTSQQAQQPLWSHHTWPIHVHDSLSLTATMRFKDWHIGLGRFLIRPALMISPGRVEVGDGACNDQAYARDVPLIDSAASFTSAPPHATAGRFAVMRHACPVAAHEGNNASVRPIACCGKASPYRRYCGGRLRQHERQCVGAWRAVQRSIATLDRALLLRTDPLLRFYVWQGPHKFAGSARGRGD
jgi:hypothetical protein